MISSLHKKRRVDKDQDMSEHLLRRWATWQRAASLSEETIRVRARIMRNFIAVTNTTLEDYTPEDIADFLSQDGLSANSRAAYFRAIKAFGMWRIKTGATEIEPSLMAPKPRAKSTTPRPVHAKDLVRMLDHAPTGSTRLMILLGALQGLRVHEIAKVTAEDFDLHEGTLTVTGKGGKTAILPLHDEVRRQLVRAQLPRHGFLFLSDVKKGRHILKDTVYMRIRRVMESAEVAGTPHSLRHYFGTELVRAGVNLRVVQQLMRHSTLATTQIYTLVDADMQRTGLKTLKLVA